MVTSLPWLLKEPKKSVASSSFMPYAKRVGYVKLVDYVGYVMYLGYKEFPSLEKIKSMYGL